jgi:putative ABC transport system substrate-binding protein
MDRRRFLLTTLAGALAVPLAAEAQQAPKTAKIGLLIPSTPAASAHLLEAFRQGLRDLGHVDGKTFVLELRSAEGRAERLPDLARELVRLKVDVIVTSTDVTIAAARQQTRTIPIVMTTGTDPLGTGFVASLAHPGGNVTGLSTMSPELTGKRLELLKGVVPRLSRVRFSGTPTSAVPYLITTKRKVRPVRLACSFNPLKRPGPRISTALFPQSQNSTRRR